MSRIFNLLIEHQGTTYPALLTVAGDSKENAPIRVVSNPGKIEIILPNGSLSFSTEQVLKQLMDSKPGERRSEMQITPFITLQLLQNDW